MSSKSLLASATLLVLSAMFALGADGKPDFTGTWKMDAAKSDFGGPSPSTLVLTVDHKEPVFKFLVKGTQDGNDFEESGEVTTDGKESTDSMGLLTKAHWEGNVFVVEFKSQDGSVTGLAHDTLSADGKTYTRDADIKAGDGGHKQHIVLVKQ
jgi:hypothetical protein